MKITERRLVTQDWFETELTKTGWDSHDWVFEDSRYIINEDWTVVQHLEFDKFGNPTLGVAEREVEV